jgi:ribonuclease PH
MRREASMGRQSGRTQEIQRLIGRSLRSVMDAKALGERQITVDVDVLVADGGTRTAAITGAYLAVYRACQTLTKRGDCKSFPLYDSVSAISCGLVDGTVLVDLDYEEDSTAEVDGNFVITGSGRLVEVQTTAERGHFSSDHLMRMLMSATETCRILAQSQASFLKGLVE